MARSTHTSRASLCHVWLLSLLRVETFPGAKPIGRVSYKRACERPPVVVAKRNARERRRVNNVNAAFEVLRACVPHLAQRQKRVCRLRHGLTYNSCTQVSKLRILQGALDYIDRLGAALYHNKPLTTWDVDPWPTETNNKGKFLSFTSSCA